MEQIYFDEPWMNEILPGGWPTGTSTVITGSGGTGKPLVGQVVAGSWLRQGGGVVFMSLQYPSHEFIVEGLRRISRIELEDYAGKVAFIELDARMDGLSVEAPGHIRANLVKPDIWDEALETAAAHVRHQGPGVLLFGSALNLLLFSPTYGAEILERMKQTLSTRGERTVLFTVSSTARAAQIAELEGLADNLLVSSSERNPFRILVRVERMKAVAFNPAQVEVPIAAEDLAEVKAVADHSRRRVIPLISAI